MEDKYCGLPKSTFYKKRKKSVSSKQFTGHSQRGYLKWLKDNKSETNVKERDSHAAPYEELDSENEVAPMSPISERLQTDGELQVPAPQTCLWCEEGPSDDPITTSLGAKERKPAITALCTLARNHNLTDVCMNDILKMLHDPDILLNRIEIPKSTRGLENAIGMREVSMRLGWKCTICSQFVLKNYQFGKLKSAPTCCNEKLSFANDHHIVLSVKEVMQLILPSIAEDFLESENQFDLIKLSMNTDGAPMFKSSNSSLWPVLAAVDNTLAKSRKKNVIMFGIWVGIKKSSKPDFQTFLSPILQELGELYTQPFTWADMKGNLHRSKLKLNVVLCDSIARPLVQNMSQFNAEYGCPYCYHKQKGHYFNHSNINQIQRRRRVDYNNDILRSDNTTQPSIRGVKGLSPFAILKYFDIIKGV